MFRFFAEMNGLHAAGIIVLAAGAAVTYGSSLLAKRTGNEKSEIPIKLAGLGAAVAGFLLIMQ